MGEWVGAGIARLSSCPGGSAAAISCYLVGNADPVTLAILRGATGLARLPPTEARASLARGAGGCFWSA